MIEYRKNMPEPAFITDQGHIELFAGGKKRHAKHIVDLQHAENLDLNGAREIRKKVSVCTRLVRDTDNDVQK